MAKENTTSKIVERVVLSIGSAISFAATLALAWNDKSSAATVMGAVTIALLGFYFLPFIDSIEAFGLKAKLRAQIDEAESLLSGLRRTALVSSKILYAQLAWQGRMGTAEWKTKQQWADELEENLTGLKVDQADISAARTPHLTFAVYDLFLPFEQVVRERIQSLIRENNNERSAKFPGPIPAGDPEWTRLNERAAELTAHLKFRKNLHLSDDLKNLAAVIRERVSSLPISNDEKNALLAHGNIFAVAAGEVWRQGRVTDEAMALIDRYAEPKEWMKDYKQIFPE
ncbi:MAG TPA: hypothetical protein VFT69_17090 [Pseudolabrys sp.]|nr:hypothetical protein [Pseudolabrys sp.]